MREAKKLAVVFAVTFAGLLGCGGSQNAPEAPAAPPPTEPEREPEPVPGDASPTPSENAPSRPAVTPEACKASGGVVIGDIGDGAIHRPEYRCPSGAAPTGTIRGPEGGPMAIEGSVCCPQ